jgi:hypothetical protein
MNYLAENSLPIWTAGAIALTMALVVYLQTRSNSSLGAMVGIVLIAAALLALESWLETPREAVERTLYELVNNVEANDVEGTLELISPAAMRLRSDVETLMPLVQIELANVVGSPEIEIIESRKPPAEVKAQVVIQATVRRDGMKGTFGDKFVLGFDRAGDRWLLTDLLSSTKGYAPEVDWRRRIGAEPLKR